MPTFVEFFAGGGFARLGLGAAWTCLLANDICPRKAATYKANFGEGELRLQDVRTLKPSSIPAADLWWASFPCQDHSAAGSRVGFAGDRGSLVFEISRLLEAALLAGAAPKLVVMENVVGFLRAAGGADFVSLVTATSSAGYRIGAVMMDARDFVPQSRQRMVMVAARGDVSIPAPLISERPDGRWCTKTLVKAAAALPPTVRDGCGGGCRRRPRAASTWMRSLTLSECLTRSGCGRGRSPCCCRRLSAGMRTDCARRG